MSNIPVEEQADIATEDGSPIENRPMWRKDGEEVYIDEMTDEQIQEAVEQVEGSISHHRSRIFSRYQSISTLVDVRNDLAEELEDRGINLMIPKVSTKQEA